MTRPPAPDEARFGVGIRGDGVAAAACARLLEAAGVPVGVRGAARRDVPVVMVSDAARLLLCDVFDRPTLFDGLPRVWRRVVDWGGREQALPHGATLVSGDAMRAALPGGPSGDERASDFVIHATLPPGCAPYRFGERLANATRVRLRATTCREECRIEAVRSGWLFLVPETDDHGVLLAIGADADTLLGESRSVAPRVQPIGAIGDFPAAPSLTLPLCGPQWLACGSAAMSFDPICGDGAAQSAREAILAAAVIAEIASGGDADALLLHYQSMLIATMRRHLALCAQFYRSGGDSDWWRAQHAALVEGHEWCTGMLMTLPEPRFMLRGFRLVPRLAAA